MLPIDKEILKSHQINADDSYAKADVDDGNVFNKD